MTHRTYLGLVIPLLLASLTTPFLGIVDTAIVGRFPDASYLGGVAIATMIFNTLYWLFGFLRVATSGFTAQALGSGNEENQRLALIRPFSIALIVGSMFILLQVPILYSAVVLTGADPSVSDAASTYFSIRIWGAPFALANFVLLGWLMGMSYVKLSLLLVFLTNALNILLSLLFVPVFQWGMEGLAAATLVAEMASTLLGLLIVQRKIDVRSLVSRSFVKNVLGDKQGLKKIFQVNRDLFIRTICLLLAFQLFTIVGAQLGTEVLAANAILMQMQFLIVYMFDGFANASSILTGKAIGGRDKTLYYETVKMTLRWCIYSSLLLAGIYWLTKDLVLPMFTTLESVLVLLGEFSHWPVYVALTAGFGVLGYGLFTGATEVSYVRNSMIWACALYVLSLYPLIQIFGNHGLWVSFILFCGGRSVFLFIYLPRLHKKLWGNEEGRV
ncbi:MATE family efflux transporter [Aureibacillus halotolerans]|uniref:MATE family multidrug resistance protein n=1 Tax=Aureibacillus halotolerans TaxID=1508390 RepID=A0A4V3D4B9_9BACI|nr:MATE family efflux transporter [Aureibacillus halotolerans]TDQ34596.1 MATE family multidrug resistance protein [Aureibacillus halotolerans]